MVSQAEMTVLVVLSHGEHYGREILERTAELTGRSARLVVGGLYTLLHRMEKKGLIKGRWEEAHHDDADGARRRYYSITGAGVTELRKAQDLLAQAASTPRLVFAALGPRLAEEQ
jgi:DNA-binding PadR family transcriptional regulator